MNRWKQLTGIGALLLAGCNSGETTGSIVYDEYEKAYNEIGEVTDFKETSENYAISYEMVLNDDGTYTYCIIVDEPRISMYDVTVMAVEEGVGIQEKMMPSIGIFDGPYTMIPSQINREGGYVKGLAINGTTSQSPVVLRLLVEWEDSHGTAVTQEYYRIRLDENVVEYVPVEGEGA